MIILKSMIWELQHKFGNIFNHCATSHLANLVIFLLAQGFDSKSRHLKLEFLRISDSFFATAKSIMWRSVYSGEEGLVLI